MARTDAAPKPRERPGDCPKGAAYIKVASEGKPFVLPGNPPLPIVLEGGKGNDVLIVDGGPGEGVWMDGGDGDDRLIIGKADQAAKQAESSMPAGLILGALIIAMATVAFVAWRALSTKR